MMGRVDSSAAEKPPPGSGLAEIEADPRCCLCGTDSELSYCTFCGKYFCAACERNYPARVIAVVRYPLDFTDLPLAGWIPPSAVRAEHAEWIDPFRSGIGLGVDDSP